MTNGGYVKKNLFALALALSFFFPSPDYAETPPSPALRVVQWNVFYEGLGTDGIRNRGRQVATLAALNPDVVTMNELTANAAVDYAAGLERATGVHWYHHHVSGAGRLWGNAVLSRYPIVAAGGYRFRVGASRSIAQATLDVDGATVNVFATHLDSGDHAANRAAQAQELLAFVEGFPTPRIFAGDLNARPDWAEIRPLSADYDDLWMSTVYGGTARSYAANPPHRYTRTRGGRLDYIFASRDLLARECQVPDLRDLTNTNVKTFVKTTDDDGVRPSDHNLVSCVVAWNDPPPADPVDDTDTDTDTDGAVGAGGGAGDADDPVDNDDSGNGETNPDVEPDPDDGLPPVDACGVENADESVLAQPQLPADASNDDIVLRPATAATLAGNWVVESDCSAAGGARVVNPDLGLPVTAAVPDPVDYIDMTFNAEAGKPYRLWMRAKAAANNWANDSVSVQFSGAVDALGAPTYRIGTEGRTLLRLEDCVGCGLSGWGWQDNGFGPGVLGREIYFETTGPQTIRIQRREDGISIDQIVLSARTWLSTPPGPTKHDATILSVKQGEPLKDN
jgi:endonuclease/exonuclease/phosphatase family metal-dependent hydrolase